MYYSERMICNQHVCNELYLFDPLSGRIIATEPQSTSNLTDLSGLSKQEGSRSVYFSGPDYEVRQSGDDEMSARGQY